MDFTGIPLNTVFDIKSIVNITYYRPPVDYTFPGETHECWEFIYIDRGSLVVTAGADTYFMKAGELAFHCPNEFHSFQAIGETSILVASFYCDSEAMHKLEKKVLLLNKNEKESLKLLVDEAQQVYEFFENVSPYINMTKREDAPWGSDQIIKTRLEQFLIYVCRRDDNVGFSQRAISSINPNYGIVLAQRIKDYMDMHFAEKISLSSLADRLGVSVSQIKRVFREQIGQSMVNYLTDLRISRAKRLIRDGNANFTQIAATVGYDSIYYFSSLFKKRTGMTLSEYAKSLKD